MAVTLSPLTTNQSFGVWFERTNQIMEVLSANVITTAATTTGAPATGNVNITGSVGISDLAATVLRGSNGTLSNTQTLVIASNVTINTTAYIGNSSANSLVGFNPSTNASYTSNGNINSYLQTVIQNANGGGNATTDLIINADTATDTTNFLDIGVNSSGYSNTDFSINGALDSYIYSSNGSLAIGTASAKPLQFFANGTFAGNEVMRIDAGANVGIGTTTPNAKLQVNGTANVSGNVTFSGNLIVTGTSTLNNVSVSINQTVGGNLTVTNILSTNTRIFIGNSASNATVNTTIYTGTANNANNLGGIAAASYQLNSTLADNVATMTANNTSFVGSVTAANVVSNSQLQANIQYFVNNSQLSANLANYTTTAGLPAVIAINTANNTSFVGSVTAANVVSNSQLQANIQFFVNTSQLSANLANYQTSAGLAANVATLTANNTSFVGAVTAANVVSNAQLIANLANYQTTAGLSANVATLVANNTSFVGSVTAANVVSNAQLIANLANYQTTAGLNANIASYLPTYAGTVNATAFVTTRSSVNTIGVHVTNSVGNVFIANTLGVSVSANLTVNTFNVLGYANIANNLGVTGTVIIGGDLQVTGSLTYNGTGTASIVPNANNAYTLGNTSFVWNSVYSGNNFITNLLSVGGNTNIGANLTVNGTSFSVNGSITANGSLNVNTSNYLVSLYSVPTQANPNTNLQTMDFYDASVYRSAEYTIQIAANTAPGVTNYHTTKILVMHDGVSAYTTEYGSMLTGSSLATFQADIGTVGALPGQLRLRMTPLNTNVVAKFIRTTMAV